MRCWRDPCRETGRNSPFGTQTAGMSRSRSMSRVPGRERWTMTSPDLEAMKVRRRTPTVPPLGALFTGSPIRPPQLRVPVK